MQSEFKTSISRHLSLESATCNPNRTVQLIKDFFFLLNNQTFMIIYVRARVWFQKQKAINGLQSHANDLF